MEVYKLTGIFEMDGLTPKQNTYQMDYKSLINTDVTFPVEPRIGSSCVFIVNELDELVRTSTVRDIVKDVDYLKIETKNTLYIFA